jgi:hypothetical protein
MALLEVDFVKAIEGFASVWRSSSTELEKIGDEYEHKKQNGWDDVQVADKVSCWLSFDDGLSYCLQSIASLLGR